MTPPGVVETDRMYYALTRAIGNHFATRFGLSHVPSISTHIFDPDEAYVLVVATDGVWDAWPYDRFGQFIVDLDTKAPLEICDAVVKASVDWAVNTYFSPNEQDDVTVACAFIGPART